MPAQTPPPPKVGQLRCPQGRNPECSIQKVTLTTCARFNHLISAEERLLQVVRNPHSWKHDEEAVAVTDCVTMAVVTMEHHSTTEAELHPGGFWENLQRGCLTNYTNIVFNPEDIRFYPRICKTRMWQVILHGAIVQYELQPATTTLTLYQGQISYTPMEPFTFTINAVFRSCQPDHEEITFLRNIGLERFTTQVPWGVLHPTMVAKTISALKLGGTTTFLKGKDVTLFPETHWQTRLANVFQLTAKMSGEPAQGKIKDIFPTLSTLPKNQNTIRV